MSLLLSSIVFIMSSTIQLLHLIVCRIVHIDCRYLACVAGFREVVVWAQERTSARGRHACLPLARPFFLGPAKLPLKTIISQKKGKFK